MTNRSSTVILIPAYEPRISLVALVAELRSAAPELGILVVDDGSGPEYAGVFEAAAAEGAEVIGYDHNRGKGHALKHGFRHLHEHAPEQNVVCADSDGQHRPDDILRVAARLAEVPERTMVLGGRTFAGDVPARSRFGNTVSRATFRFTTGIAVRDTQTGLRGYPAALLPWLESVPGDRFEYELNLLLRSSAADIRIDEIEIETVYLEHNASSHFRPVRDSVRVFAPMLAFAAASLASFAIDAVGVLVLYAITDSLLFAVVSARLVSAAVNFTLNRRVFRSAAPGRLRTAIARYVALALGMLAASYLLLDALTVLAVPLVVAKLVTDVALYLVSFQVQRRWVFAPRRRSGVVAERAQGALGGIPESPRRGERLDARDTVR